MSTKGFILQVQTNSPCPSARTDNHLAKSGFTRKYEYLLAVLAFLFESLCAYSLESTRVVAHMPLTHDIHNRRCPLHPTSKVSTLRPTGKITTLCGIQEHCSFGPHTPVALTTNISPKTREEVNPNKFHTKPGKEVQITSTLSSMRQWRLSCGLYFVFVPFNLALMASTSIKAQLPWLVNLAETLTIIKY